MLFITKKDLILSIGLNYKGEAYIKGANREDHIEALKVQEAISKCKDIMKLGKYSNIRYHTDKANNHIGVVEYGYLNGSILLNISTGEQYYVNKNFKHEVSSDISEYKSQLYPSFALEWFTYKERPFDIIKPGYMFKRDDKDLQDSYDLIDEVWDSEIYNTVLDGEKLVVIKSKTEHTTVSFIVKDFNYKSLSLEQKSKILLWHKSLGETTIDYAILQTILI